MLDGPVLDGPVLDGPVLDGKTLRAGMPAAASVLIMVITSFR
jgi:hypothetical protein